jgi:hypothetical protein
MKVEIDNRKKNYQNLSDVPNNGNTLSGKRDVTDNAREEAMEDIEEDPDLSIHSPNDDLDEGEIASLGDDKTDLV